MNWRGGQEVGDFPGIIYRTNRTNQSNSMLSHKHNTVSAHLKVDMRCEGKMRDCSAISIDFHKFSLKVLDMETRTSSEIFGEHISHIWQILYIGGELQIVFPPIW